MKTMTRWMTATLLLAFVAFTSPATLFAQEDTTDVVPAYNPKAIVDASPVQLPKITKKVLKNGLTVYYIPQHEVPVVSVRLQIPAGSLYNPLDKPGLTNFMATMLTKGTEKRSSQQIAEEIDFVGGSLNSGSGNNSTFIASDVLSRDTELAFDLMSDVVLHPTFPADEIERERMQEVSSLMADKDDPKTIASNEWAGFVYGDHPYGVPSDGDIASIKALTRDDLVAQYKKLMVPGYAVLCVAGDFNVKKTNKLVKKYFGDWKSGQVPTPEAVSPEPGKGGEILLVNKPDAVQTQIRMGYILAPYNMGDDMYAFRVMNYLFGGGGFNSRLMLKVRNELGLTYGIYSYLEARQQKGAYTISTYTRTPATDQMLSEILGVMNRTIKDGFTQKDLDDAKAYLIGSYPQRFETPAQIAMNFQTALLFDFGDPKEYIANYRQKLADVTLDDINAMAKKYLKPEMLRMTVVGKAADIKPVMEKYGDVKVVELDNL